MRLPLVQPTDHRAVDTNLPPVKPSSLRQVYEWAIKNDQPTPTETWQELRKAAGPKTSIEDRLVIDSMSVSEYPKAPEQQKTLSVFRHTLKTVKCEGSRQEGQCEWAKYMLNYVVANFDRAQSK